MDIRDYLRVLRLRWRLVALFSLGGFAAGVLLTVLTAPSYEARAQLFVSTQGDGASGLQQGGQFAQQRVKSYAQVLDSPMVTAPVIKALGLDLTPQELAERVEATAPLDTVLIDVTVRDGSAERARQIANAVADQFVGVAASLERPDSRDASAVRVSVVRRADVPLSPVAPRPALNVVLGLLVGLGVGIASACLRDALDTTIGSPAHIQETLRLPSLGVIPFDGDAETRPLIVQASPRSGRAEAFRQLRTNLQFLDVDDRPRSIVMTSAMPSEGKSTTLCNLAVALSQAGMKVALVDGDLRLPRLASYMGLEGAVGLTDVLVGRADLQDVLQPWGDSGVLLLPSGAIPPNPSELLGSQQMKDLLAELEHQVDLVLIDAPPVLPVTDAAVLATHVSGAIVVVRAGRTTRDQAGRAVEILRGVDAHVYGVVLNMVPARGPASYGYGYGYGATAVTIPAVPAAAGPPGAPDHRLGLVAGHGPQPAADPALLEAAPSLVEQAS